MRRAILSDIHANREALSAVLADIRRQGIREIYCLGDLVGYGQQPQECIDLAMESFSMCLMGNHDEAILFGDDVGSLGSTPSIGWTREQLARQSDPESISKRWDFLMDLPTAYQTADVLYVHASPRDPVREYIFPEDIYNRRKMEQIFSKIKRVCFCGHTHLPGVFTKSLEFFTPEQLRHHYRINDEKLIVNVGSVGLPRDGDLRPGYVIYDDETIHFQRVAI